MNKYAKKIEQLTYFGGHLPRQAPNLVSEAELANLESQIGHSLPADYREFLSEYGDFFVASAAEIPEPKPDGPAYGAIECFYGVVPSNIWKDIATAYRHKGQGWPREFLPIAWGDNGYTCLVIAGEEKGAVYFFNCGQSSGEEEMEIFHFIADSFDSFMQLLD